MNLFEFNQRFPDEQSCKNYLKDLRMKSGITCDRILDETTGEVCGCTKHYWLEKIGKFQCSECNDRTNLKSGTIMYKSKIPLMKWFLCIHLMTTTKKPFSSLELQRQLGFKRYEPIWEMMCKIRHYMGLRDKRYELQGDIEIDEGFFEVVDLPGNSEDLKRGRGSQRQRKVLVMIESTPNPKQTNKHKKKRIMGYVKMIVMDEVNNIGVNYEIQKSVNEKSHIISDNFQGYSKLKDVVEKHTRMTVRPGESMEKLPWVHTIISNVKRELLGVHHSIGKDYLQGYLNEFCYKLNRRNFESDMFERMLICSVESTDWVQNKCKRKG